jgi:lysophospholipase L1-like esterase
VFWRKYLSRRVGLVGLLLACAIFIVIPAKQIVRADVVGGWFNGTPQINKVGSASAGDTQYIDPGNCTTMSLPVVRSLYQQLFTNNEQHCMMRTSEGLLDPSATLIQPNDFPKAYPIDYSGSGYPAIIPAPNSPSAFAITGDPAYPGANIGLYKQLSNHLTFNNNILSPRFNLSGPDLYFRYPSGRGMAFNVNGTLNFSNGGTYVVVEAMYYGFVRINLTTLQMTAFAPNGVLNSGGNPLGAVTAISPSGKYAVLAYNSPGGWGDKYFKVIDIDSCGGVSGAYNSSTSSCQTVDYLSAAQKAIPGLSEINSITFANDDTFNFVATTGDGAARSYGRYEMTAAGKVARLEQYLALGDSFASGEGTFSYNTGTDTSENKCHQSIYSYPYVMNALVGLQASVACSGALEGNINALAGQKANQLKDIADSDITPTQKQNAYAMHLPGITLQNNFLSQDNPQAVTISIGGNDVGFADIILRCIVPYDGGEAAQNCYGTYEERKSIANSIDSQFENLYETYLKLRSGDPTRRVYVIGYPQLVKQDGDCGLNVHMSQSETEFAPALESYLNAVIAKAAAKAGVVYVDTEHAFDGHKLCEAGTKAVNGLTAGNEIGHIIGNESYHPNQLGHELLANTILAATHNLTSQMPEPQNITAPVATDDIALLQAPKINSAIYAIENVSQDILQASPGALLLNIDQFKNIVRPNSTFQAVLHSTPTNVGVLSSNASGSMSGTIQIPSGLPTGFHTLHLYGKNKFGDVVDIQETVFLNASANDYDGDGVPNGTDSCPFVPQSHQDIDQDGIDDACDPVIGEAPVKLVPPPTGTVTESTTTLPGPDELLTDTHVLVPAQPAKVVAQVTLTQSAALTSQPVSLQASDNGQVLGISDVLYTASEVITPPAVQTHAPAILQAKIFSQHDKVQKTSWLAYGGIMSILALMLAMFVRWSKR